MKALSIRQPWPWFIFNGRPQKLIENRSWTDAYLKAQLSICPIGSNFQIHASSGMTRKEFDEACEFAADDCGCSTMPDFATLKRGGILGIARLADVVRESRSPWFCGPVGLVLTDLYPEPFMPCKGSLGFFDIP